MTRGIQALSSARSPVGKEVKATLRHPQRAAKHCSCSLRICISDPRNLASAMSGAHHHQTARGGGPFFGPPAGGSTSSARHVRFSSSAHLEKPSGVDSAVHSSDSTQDPNLELSPKAAAARKGMLERPIFPTFKNDATSADLEDPEEMQKNDPLATQIWKLYSKAKTQLPNAERMENLTWRMMAMSMRRAELDRNKGYAIRHVAAAPSTCGSPKPLLTFPPFHRVSQTNEMQPPRTVPSSSGPRKSAPSGIAQLRQSVDEQARTPQPDAMDYMDDFIYASSVGSPSGLPASPSNDTAAPSHATAPAIPIRNPNQSHDQFSLARASAPSVPPTVVREQEFGYVQRHVRKTSIDERRVSSNQVPCHHLHTSNTLSASQAASRGLSSCARRQQHHDSDRPRGRGRFAFILARPDDAPFKLPLHATTGALCHRHPPIQRGPDNILCRSLPAEFRLLARGLAALEPEPFLLQHVQSKLDCVVSQLHRLLLTPRFRLPVHRIDSTAPLRRRSNVL